MPPHTVLQCCFSPRPLYTLNLGSLTLCREAHLPILQGNMGASMQGDLNTAGFDGPLLPFLDGASMLHLCLITLALTTLALAAGLGDLEVSLEEG